MKKQRGLKKKIKNIILRINNDTKFFPTEYFNGDYYNYKIPAGSDLLRYSNKLKIQISQLLIERTLTLINLKPDKYKESLVTLILIPDDIWNSEIIIHKNKQSQMSFYNRNNIFQKWRVIDNDYKSINLFGLDKIPYLQFVTIENQIIDEDEKKIQTFFVIGEVFNLI